MSDFNKGDLPPERERKRIYATVLYSLIKDGRYKPSSQLEGTVNKYAMAGYDTGFDNSFNRWPGIVTCFQAKYPVILIESSNLKTTFEYGDR